MDGKDLLLKLQAQAPCFCSECKPLFDALLEMYGRQGECGDGTGIDTRTTEERERGSQEMAERQQSIADQKTTLGDD